MRLQHADRVEVLAPAGSMASMRAALRAGADAVYMGGSRFGARAYAENPEEQDFLGAIDEVHLHGRRLYLTLNTLLKDREMERDLYNYVLPMYEHGLDGVIVQDLGVLSFLHEQFPDLPLHASTQMTVTGAEGAKLAARQGVSRVVPARELTITEIREIAQTGLEVEVFIHGALCYCYSGQCFLSSFIGGRSGNRGRCAGPCRLPYEVSKDGVVKTRSGEDYVLSLKDLCGLHALPDLLDAGVYSLKIEGRMKSPVYAAGVTSVYREYADRYLEEGRKGYRVDEKDVRFLKELFDRGGFTDYYYLNKDSFGDRTGREIVARKEKPEFRKTDETALKSVEEKYVQGTMQEPIRGSLWAKKGELLTLTAELDLPEGPVAICQTGSIVEAAQKQPMKQDALEKQMAKTGNTPFYWESLDVEADSDIFVPMGALNELRRNALTQLESAACEMYRRETIAKKSSDKTEWPTETEKKEWQVYIEDMAYLPAVLARPVDAVLVDCACVKPSEWHSLVKRCHEHGKKCYLGMPYIFRIHSRVEWKENRDLLEEAGFDGFLVRNVDEAGFLEELGISGERIGEPTAYTLNMRAREVWKEHGVARFVMPVELNRAELKQRRHPQDGLLLYGYLPMMVSAGCVQRTMDGCNKKQGWHMLTDRKRETFAVKNVCRYCYNVMFNSKPLSLHGCYEEISDIAPGFYRIHLIRETVTEAEQILDRFMDEFSEGKVGTDSGKAFTRGHFKRGVE